MSTNTPPPSNQKNQILVALVLADIVLQITTKLWALRLTELSGTPESRLYVTLVVVSLAIYAIVKLWTMKK
ncbi:hypothetical protein [Corallococcus silvisoli]|uniref:hypothetical protein n=1 Tax=Corallococcus silvisoli TaxID=2697031 RepID=UPI001377B579|nr:hypothetical protein [Corallococcus silvisoli]NBD12944.1 hypothetical protein [Corallococcus silvisoli]